METQKDKILNLFYIEHLKVKEIAEKIGLKTVPELKMMNFTSYEELKEKYVDNQKSALEGTDCIREGIVIKTLDGEKRIKIVGDKFQEVKSIKNTETKSPFAFLDRYITPMRICKFLTTLGIENPKPEDYREIFKNLDVIAQDILEEEKEQILIDINRIIKKQAVPNIKEYVESKWFYDKRNKKHIKERLKEIWKLSKYNRRRSTRDIYGSSYVFSRINKWMRRYKWIEKTLKITSTVKSG